MKVLFKLKSKNAKKCHWVLESSPKTFHTLLRKKKVFFEWHRLSLREFIRPTRCYKCNRFGDISPKGPNEETCPNCGQEGHKKTDCENEANCINCNEANFKFKLGHSVDHTATVQSCPAYNHQVEQLISKTDYGR
ncbi:hypothetical protein AVEN_114632-1 [Araneus ventricosus]|uniref:CCHC-type domain-containing protein n=1 Tax=Araneus ventricosus TaxID=182803 RepID=A0A4Y2GG38_ARAVE|nr:hypothetical protein AVEN_114632-1 [Araneus ventricosus]